MSVAPYGIYKPTGVDWLGDVPTHWDVVPLKYLVRLRSGGTPSKENRDYWDGSIPWASAKDLKAEKISDTIDHISERAIETGAADLVPEYSVLVLVRGMTLAHSFPVVLTLGPMAINQDLKAVVAHEGVAQDFLAWVLRGSAADSLSRVDEAGHGTKALRMEAWTSMLLPVPSPQEQQSITAFLDRETAKIDALVDEQRRLIELLKEKRQAVISHAVTKGLDPNAPMKDSGVEWLGEVPEHWEVKRLASLCRFVQGKAHEPFIDDDGEYICVTARFVSTQGEKTKRCSRNMSPANKNDIVMVMSDLPNGRALARAYFIDENDVYAVNQRVCAISAKEGNPRYFYYQLNRNQQLLRYDDGANQTHLSNRAFTTLMLSVPPRSEQDAVANYLDREICKLDALTIEAERAVIFLQERRSAIISAAVTGKIDVRGVAQGKAEAA